VRLKIQIDSVSHEIDSADPVTLGRWVVEILARTELAWSPATYIMLQAFPSWLPTEDGRGRCDWIADSRVIGNLYPVRTPQDVVDALQQQIDDLGLIVTREAEHGPNR
jgi:hypothetical protein